MIDECDFYLQVIGARYGSIDEETGISTEKEYNYAKLKDYQYLYWLNNLRLFLKVKSDTGNDKYDKNEETGWARKSQKW